MLTVAVTHPPSSQSAPVLDTWVDEGDGPSHPCPRRFVSPTVLPHAVAHQHPDYRGADPDGIGTTRQSNADTASYLARVESVPSLSEEGLESETSTMSDHVSSVFGARDLERGQRPLILNTSVLVAGAIPHPILECPFRFLGCHQEFNVTKVPQWKAHSQTHFEIPGRRGPRRVRPPLSSRCCFCDQTFSAVDGIISWEELMDHVLLHHRLGHRLATARLDFALVEYLWTKGVMTPATYRELKPRAEALRNGRPMVSLQDNLQQSTPPSGSVPLGGAMAVISEPGGRAANVSKL